MSTLRTNKDNIDMDRRGFLSGLFSTGALILACDWNAAYAYAGESALEEGTRESWQPNAYVGLNPDGTVVIVAPDSGMPKSAQTSLARVLADEMGADWQRVRVEQTLQNTSFSGDAGAMMRQAGATARLMLERAAAQRWDVMPTECRAENHAVLHVPTGRRLAFSELIVLASRQPQPLADEIALETA